MADNFIFDSSLDDSHMRSPFIEKKILTVNDSNSGAYNGSINIDSTVLANSGSFLNFKEGVITIPLAISMKASEDISTTANSFMLGLKNGTHHLIDSLTVDYNNSNVIQLQAFTNFYVSYKIITTWGEDDQVKYGAQVLYQKDTPDSFRYAATGSAFGEGVSNNQAFSSTQKVFVNTALLSDSNSGFGERLKYTAYSPVETGGGLNDLGVMTTVAQCNQASKNYWTYSGSGADRIYEWRILATIRLKDVSDFFAQLPLVRGAQLRFTINYNSARVVLAPKNNLSMDLTSTTLLSGRTVPFMVSSAQTGSAWNATASLTEGSVTIEQNIVSTSNPAGSASALQSSCRLVVPGYVLEPQMELKYLSLGRKLVEYTDIYAFTILSVSSGSSFNSILTNGISNPQQLVVIPMLSGTATNNGSAFLNQFQSVFDTAPATTCPLSAITSFNVLISGRSIFQSNQSQDWDAFQNELAIDNGISGGQMTGLVSGLISRHDFDNGYRYYVVDLQRRLREEDSVPKSVQIQGINDTTKLMDYYCFVTYKRSVEIDLASGALVK